MKGLLLKEFYILKTYYKIYILTMAVFIGSSIISRGSISLTFYPFLLVIGIAITIMNSDEKSGWSKYCSTLPYTRAKIVSSKFIVNIIILMCSLLVSGSAEVVIAILNGNLDARKLILLLSVYLAFASVMSAFEYLIIFKFGSAKAMLIYYAAMAVFLTSVVGILSILRIPMLFSPSNSSQIILTAIIVVLVAAVIYSVLWLLSIMVYKNHEIS